MKGEEFLQVARNLVESCKDATSDVPVAANVRTAISRAYYAALSVACRVLRSVGADIPTGSTHQFVTDCLNKCDSPDILRAKKYISDLKKERVKADYKLDQAGVENPDMAHHWIESAQKAIELLNDAASDPQKSVDLRLAYATYQNITRGKQR